MALNPREVLRWLRMPWARNAPGEQVDAELSILPRLQMVAIAGVIDESGALKAAIPTGQNLLTGPLPTLVPGSPFSETIQPEDFVTVDLGIVSMLNLDTLILVITSTTELGEAVLKVEITAGSGASKPPITFASTAGGSEVYGSPPENVPQNETWILRFSDLRGVPNLGLRLTNNDVGAAHTYIINAFVVV